MIVKIISSYQDSYWYSNLIGSIFEVDNYKDDYIIKKIIFIDPKNIMNNIIVNKKGSPITISGIENGCHYILKGDTEKKISKIN